MSSWLWAGLKVMLYFTVMMILLALVGAHCDCVMGNGDAAVWRRLVQVGHKQVDEERLHFCENKDPSKTYPSFQPNPASENMFVCFHCS